MAITYYFVWLMDDMKVLLILEVKYEGYFKSPLFLYL